jgi:eukaryotic-like serine/threonine-protein kinase
MTLAGGRLGRYQLEKLLGSGGMGEVYLARQDVLGREVAIKVLHARKSGDQTLAGRFFQEAKSLSLVSHPNIVEIIDYGDDEGRLFLVTRYIHGESLHARLLRGALLLDQSLHILAQCASALAACHRQGIVHRDLKPHNVLLTEQGGDPHFVKLVDFGLAKLLRGDGRVVKTQTGEVFGTPLYMSPEQAADASRVDARSDIYSLGVIMYELVTGRVPFQYSTYSETLLAHTMERVRPPSELNPRLPASVENICLRCLEKEPDRRFASMDELHDALLRPETHGTSRASDTNVAPQVAARPSRVKPAVLWATVLVAGGLVAYAISRTPPEPIAATSVDAAVAAPSPAPSAAAEAVLTIKSTPSGADVLVQGKWAGKTPLNLLRSRNGASLEVEVRLRGFEPVRWAVAPTEDRDIDLILVRQSHRKPSNHAKAPPPGRMVEDELLEPFKKK